jgi:hypothetical protein
MIAGDRGTALLRVGQVAQYPHAVEQSIRQKELNWAYTKTMNDIHSELIYTKYGRFPFIKDPA